MAHSRLKSSRTISRSPRCRAPRRPATAGWLRAGCNRDRSGGRRATCCPARRSRGNLIDHRARAGRRQRRRRPDGWPQIVVGFAAARRGAAAAGALRRGSCARRPPPGHGRHANAFEHARLLIQRRRERSLLYWILDDGGVAGRTAARWAPQRAIGRQRPHGRSSQPR